ncbi:MAG: DNA polymerase III subunit alpha [Coriobacteriia bacterium]|nr:DNA polymerase III subunit alpha [Coriobacteriia bacterium]MBN2823079.1 DNA polymerase III subunit alpha [Coriobacteriia bacterium]
MNSGFVHLHTHSHFSFMDGASGIPDLITRALEMGMSALALTDHQGLYGAIRFYRKAREAGLKPILGAEVVVQAAGITGEECDLPPDERIPPSASVGFGRAAGQGFHLTLLVKDITGYRNLCRLLARAHVISADEPSLVTLAELTRHSEGLIGLSGCPNGEVGAAVLADLGYRAEQAVSRLSHCFSPGDFYIELMHLLTPDSPRYVAGLVAIAKRLGLPVVATNNVHYVRPEDFRIHDVLASAGAKTGLPGPYGRTNAELWLKPAGDMRRLFSGVPEACDATLEIAERCNLDLGLGSFHFPGVEVPKGETPYSVLSKAAWRGLEQRYRPMTPEAVERLQHELAIIQQLGFPEYFLVVKDIVDFAKSRGIRYSGRGSAGDSIVTYALGITDADPIEHDLLFERFLNPERRQMPDIDVDFDSRRRDEIIAYIYERFGHDHVAMVATVNTMTARSAVRTAARAFSLPIAEVNALSRHLPWVGARHLPEVLETYPECANHPLKDHERCGLIVELAAELDATPMHLGTHLGGFIITREPIDSWMPLQWAAKGVVVSQYDKDDIEALGLVKMDILGLRMHSAISDAVEMARARVGTDAVPEPFTIEPRDDPRVYDMISSADTVGMFQLESSGQRNLASRLKERTFDDIIAAISLFRPGPLEAEMITPFIRRRHGVEPVTVPHPMMTPHLTDTYGVIIYQEQVLRVAQSVAGFTLAEADLLRRAMTKGRSREAMERIREHFLERACGLGVELPIAGEVFRQLEGFAAYGFCKAHAACFAVVTYASAWLRVYYPAEFTAAILNNEPMGFYSPRLVLNDARRHGIGVLPPHVNASSAEFTVEDEGAAIRVGLKDILHMTSRLLDTMAAERGVRPFADLADFLRRTRAEEPAASSLIRVGALDGLGVTDAGRPPTRDEMLALLPELKAVIAREGVAGDDTLLIAPARAREREDAGHVSGWNAARRLGAELELLGLSITAHPLELATADLERRGVTWARDLRTLPDRTRVRVTGVRERAQTPRTRSGKRTCFLTLEDPTGLLDVVVFEDALNRAGETIVKHRAYLVDGILQNNHERGLAIVAEKVAPYIVRTDAGENVRLRRGVGLGPMGPTRPGAGAPEEESWEDALTKA